MFQLPTIHKQFLPKPLLMVAVFFVVVFGVFSPAFSEDARAQFVCNRVNIQTQTTTNVCRPDGSFFPTPQDCENACTWSGSACIPAAPGIECGETISSTGIAYDKDGHMKDTKIGGFVAGLVVGTLVEILEAINYMLTYVVAWFAQLFDGVVAISLAGLSGIDAVTRGWTITRDVANIFFIFALLVIAIATILRLESYGAKQLLPKLIIAALLINFSLVIAFAVVDASNILALAFINEIGTPSVSNSIATVLQLGKITDTTSVNGEHIDIDPKNSLSVGMETTIKTQLDQEFTNDPNIVTATPALQNKEDNNIIRFFWQATILILQLTLMFVFVALSVMLLIRSVALIMLFVLAPLGFLASVLPATRTYSSKWWQKLFEWSFFFPASAFMIYLAIAFGAQMSQALNGGGGGNQVINTGVLFSYFATVAFLMGSLVVAKQMGIVGAAAAVGIGVGMAKAVRGYAGKQSLRYVAAPAAGLVTKTAAGLSNIPYLGKPLRYALAPIVAPASAIQRAGTRVKEGRNEDIKKRVTDSPSANRATLNALVSPSSQQAFREALLDKGQGKVLTQEELRQDVRRYKDKKEFGKLRKIYAYDPTLAAEGEATSTAAASAVSQAAQGLSVDDIRTKTNAGAISNALFADSVLLNYGSQKLEASAEAFGVNMGPALENAYKNLREKKLDEILTAAGRTRTTATGVDEQDAHFETVKQLSKENPDILKFVNRNQIMNISSPTFTNTVKTTVTVLNERAEDEAETAMRNREAARGRGTPISDAEVAQAKKQARKIEI